MQPETRALPSTQVRVSQARLLTAAYYASFILLGLATAAEGPSLPALARHTATSLDRISLIFVTGSLGYMLGSMVGGRLYDRLPGHRVIAASFLLMLAAAIVYPVAAVLWVLLAAAFITGFGKGALDVGCNTLLQWIHGAQAGPFLNGLHFAFGLGSFFSPILLAQVLLRTGDIHWLFWTIAILLVPLALWLWVLPSPRSPHEHAAGERAPVAILPLLFIVVAFVLYVGAEVGFSSWLYTYAVQLQLANAITAAYLTSAFWASFTIGRLLGIWVAARARPRVILFIDISGCLLSVALIGLATNSVLALWIGSIGLGLFMASIFPTLLVLASERLVVTGVVTGWFLVGSGVGGMVVPWLLGNALAVAGPRAMIGIVLITLLLDLLVTLVFMYGTRRSPQELPSP